MADSDPPTDPIGPLNDKAMAMLRPRFGRAKVHKVQAYLKQGGDRGDFTELAQAVGNNVEASWKERVPVAEELWTPRQRKQFESGKMRSAPSEVVDRQVFSPNGAIVGFRSTVNGVVRYLLVDSTTGFVFNDLKKFRSGVLNPERVTTKAGLNDMHSITRIDHAQFIADRLEKLMTPDEWESRDKSDRFMNDDALLEGFEAAYDLAEKEFKREPAIRALYGKGFEGVEGLKEHMRSIGQSELADKIVIGISWGDAEQRVALGVWVDDNDTYHYVAGGNGEEIAQLQGSAGDRSSAGHVRARFLGNEIIEQRLADNLPIDWMGDQLPLDDIKSVAGEIADAYVLRTTPSPVPEPSKTPAISRVLPETDPVFLTEIEPGNKVRFTVPGTAFPKGTRMRMHDTVEVEGYVGPELNRPQMRTSIIQGVAYANENGNRVAVCAPTDFARLPIPNQLQQFTGQNLLTVQVEQQRIGDMPRRVSDVEVGDWFVRSNGDGFEAMHIPADQTGPTIQMVAYDRQKQTVVSTRFPASNAVILVDREFRSAERKETLAGWIDQQSIAAGEQGLTLLESVAQTRSATL